MTKIEDFIELIPENLYDKSGAVFYSGRRAFEGRSQLYVLGENPGGSPETQADNTVAAHVRWIREDAPASWSAYEDEAWGRPSAGKHPLQQCMLHIVAKLGLDLREVPASNVAFVRTRERAQFGEDDFQQVASACWRFHATVIKKLGVRVVACWGQRSGDWVRGRLVANRPTERIEGDDRGWRGTYRNADGLAVVVLTHPSRAWLNRPDQEDPAGLLERALKKA